MEFSCRTAAIGPLDGGRPESGRRTGCGRVGLLLPAVILAVTAVLGPEDKEVLAYLILRSKTGGAAVDEERRRCRRMPAGSGWGCWARSVWWGWD